MLKFTQCIELVTITCKKLLNNFFIVLISKKKRHKYMRIAKDKK